MKLTSGTTVEEQADYIQLPGRSFSRFLPHAQIEYSEPGVFSVTAEVSYALGNGTRTPTTTRPPTKLPDLSGLLLSEKHSDLALRVGNHFLPVHKAILGEASTVLDRAFRRLGGQDVLVVADCSVAAVKTLLRFAYTGSLCGPALPADGDDDDDEDEDQTGQSKSCVSTA